MSIWTHPPQNIGLRCPRCPYTKDELQTYHLTETDMHSLIHRYECESCGYVAKLTQQNAWDLVKAYRRPSLWQRILKRGAA